MKNKTKKQLEREQIFNKYNGHCSYCGKILSKGWHIDHMIPIQRNMSYNYIKKRFVPDGTCLNPEMDIMENKVPACPSCNHIKGSSTLEVYRSTITNFIKSLNRDSTQYKFAKKYGLLAEIDTAVIFYFEK